MHTFGRRQPEPRQSAPDGYSACRSKCGAGQGTILSLPRTRTCRSTLSATGARWSRHARGAGRHRRPSGDRIGRRAAAGDHGSALDGHEPADQRVRSHRGVGLRELVRRRSGRRRHEHRAAGRQRVRPSPGPSLVSGAVRRGGRDSSADGPRSCLARYVVRTGRPPLVRKICGRWVLSNSSSSAALTTRWTSPRVLHRCRPPRRPSSTRRGRDARRPEPVRQSSRQCRPAPAGGYPTRRRPGCRDNGHCRRDGRPDGRPAVVAGPGRRGW